MSRPDQLESWFSPLRFSLLVASLVAACFPGVLAGSETFFFRDYAIFSYPLAAYHKASFWNGELPLWNPYNTCGLPFLAQWNTMVLYPLSVLYLFLPLPWSLNFFCLAHFFLAALGMYFLARHWTKSNLAGAIAGLAFVFGGVMLSCLKWPNNTAALGWMPWVVFTLDKALDRWGQGGARPLGIAVLAATTQMLTGAPEVILLTWGFLAVWVGYRFFSSRPRNPALLGRFALVALLVTGLAAAQLLPFLDLLLHSQRDTNFSGSEWPMPIWGWANFLLPLFKMFPGFHQVHAQPGQFWISTYYTSLGAVLLALFGLVKARSGQPWLLGTLLFLALWMALGERGLLYDFARRVLPGVSMLRFPIKFVVLAAFLIPLLAALGLARLIQLRELGEPGATLARTRARRALWVLALLLGGLTLGILAYAELHPFRHSRPFWTARNGLWRLFFLGGSALALFWFLRREPSAKASGADRSDDKASHQEPGEDRQTSKPPKPGQAAPIAPFAAGLLCLLIVLDGLTHSTWHNPSVPYHVYDGSAVDLSPRPRLGQGRAMMNPEAAVRVDHLSLDTGYEDVMASRRSLNANINLLEGIPKADGFYALYPAAMSQLQKAIFSTVLPPSPGFADLLGVTHWAAPGTFDEWLHRATALPLVYAPRQIVVTNDSLAAILAPDFEPRAKLFLAESLPPKEAAQSLEAGDGSRVVRDLDWRPHRITFTAELTKPAVVSIAQTFYHPWRAWSSGRPIPILRGNHAFQAIALPAGKNEVVLEYRDRAFLLGRIISAAFGLVTIWLVITGRD